MRVWAVIIFGGALLAYGLTRPAAVQTPALKAAVVDLPPATTAKAAVPVPASRPATVAREPPNLASPAPSKTAAATAANPAPPPSVSPTKRTAEILTVAAIAALIIQESRNAYYATGRPCACPDDTMRNGRSCGSKSAYSRPGGAAPLCYPTDVSDAMIRSYRARLAER